MSIKKNTVYSKTITGTALECMLQFMDSIRYLQKWTMKAQFIYSLVTSTMSYWSQNNLREKLSTWVNALTHIQRVFWKRINILKKHANSSARSTWYGQAVIAYLGVYSKLQREALAKYNVVENETIQCAQDVEKTKCLSNLFSLHANSSLDIFCP